MSRVHGTRYSEVIDQEDRFVGGGLRGEVSAVAVGETVARAGGRNGVCWLVSQEQPLEGRSRERLGRGV